MARGLTRIRGDGRTTARAPPPDYAPTMLLLALALGTSPAQATDVAVTVAEVPGSTRMVGMAGAYRAISEGAAAQRLNPAALAVRPPDTDRTTLDWDYVATARGLVPVLRTLDLGQLADAPLPTVGVTLGGIVRQDGHAGAVLFDLSSLYDQQSNRGTTLVEVSGGYGVSLVDDSLQLGVMPALQILRTAGDQEVLTTVMPTVGLGARWDVPDSPVRLGLSGRTPWRTRVDNPTVDGIRLPWELGAGVAIRRGRMTHGPRHDDPTGPLFVQFAFDVSLVGPLRDVTSLEAWTRDQVQSVDTPATLALATGLELEPLPHSLRIRTGVYTEPARARVSLQGTRLHGTLGLDIALFELPRGRWRWTLQPVVDASSLGIRPVLGVGLW